MPPFVPDPSLFCAAYSIRYKLSACQSRRFKMSYVPLLTQLCLWCRAEWSEHTCAVRTYSSVLPVTPTSPYFFLSKALRPRLAELSCPAWRPLQVEGQQSALSEAHSPGKAGGFRNSPAHPADGVPGGQSQKAAGDKVPSEYTVWEEGV